MKKENIMIHTAKPGIFTSTAFSLLLAVMSITALPLSPAEAAVPDTHKTSSSINVQAGAIQNQKPATAITQSQGISPERAMEIVLEHAKVSKTDAQFIKNEVEMEDGVRVYDLEFTTPSAKYEYELDYYSGMVLSMSYKVLTKDAPRH